MFIETRLEIFVRYEFFEPQPFLLPAVNSTLQLRDPAHRHANRVSRGSAAAGSRLGV